MVRKQFRVAIVYHADATGRASTKLDQSRFAQTAAAIAALGVNVEGAPYSDKTVEEVRAQLLGVDGVLVWVNPIMEGGGDRQVLNGMLADVAAKGVFVSAHPDIIRKMGTKEVLYHARSMGWGCDTRHYPTLRAMRAELPASLVSGPRVLKQIRGHSGNGIWKIELAKPVGSISSSVLPDAAIRARHAKRGSVEEEISLEQFFVQCVPYFEGQGGMVDQAYQARLPDGMLRCYMVGDRVAGFGEQLINALYPASHDSPPREAPPPGPRLYYPPTRPDFQSLKNKLEREWLSELCTLLALDPERLPVIWDADFLYGPKDDGGADTYVLCEINVSSVYPFPDDTLAPLAAQVLAQLKRSR